MKINWTAVKSVTVYILGLAAVILGAIPGVGVSAAVRGALVAVGGVIVAVERYLQGQVALAKVGAHR